MIFIPLVVEIFGCLHQQQQGNDIPTSMVFISLVVEIFGCLQQQQGNDIPT